MDMGAGWDTDQEEAVGIGDQMILTSLLPPLQSTPAGHVRTTAHFLWQIFPGDTLYKNFALLLTYSLSAEFHSETVIF